MKKVLLTIFLTSLILFCVAEKPKEKETSKLIESPVKTRTPVETRTPEKVQEKGKSRSECENCHNNPKRRYVPQAYEIEGHKNANYCISCHLRDYLNEGKEKLLKRLHEKHVNQAKCNVCHKEIGKSEWECLNCHGKDPFKPGDNIVEIHRVRGVLCEDCHGTDYLRIHISKKPFPYELKSIPPKN